MAAGQLTGGDGVGGQVLTCPLMHGFLVISQGKHFFCGVGLIFLPRCWASPRRYISP